MADQHDLSIHFDRLGLPDEAKTWLLDLWLVIQVLDDAMDGDEAGQANVARAAMAIFWDMPLNSFYRAHFAALHPVMKLQVLKWMAANDAEAKGQADERSYMWRSGYYDIVLMVSALCGCDQSSTALLLYGETFAEYLSEWKKP